MYTFPLVWCATGSRIRGSTDPQRARARAPLPVVTSPLLSVPDSAVSSSLASPRSETPEAAHALRLTYSLVADIRYKEGFSR